MGSQKDIYRHSPAREFLVVAMIKVTLAAFLFTFSTVIAETARVYVFKADNWMTEKSVVVSRKILDLYR